MGLLYMTLGRTRIGFLKLGNLISHMGLHSRGFCHHTVRFEGSVGTIMMKERAERSMDSSSSVQVDAFFTGTEYSSSFKSW